MRAPCVDGNYFVRRIRRRRRAGRAGANDGRARRASLWDCPKREINAALKEGAVCLRERAPHHRAGGSASNCRTFPRRIQADRVSQRRASRLRQAARSRTLRSLKKNLLNVRARASALKNFRRAEQHQQASAWLRRAGARRRVCAHRGVRVLRRVAWSAGCALRKVLRAAAGAMAAARAKRPRRLRVYTNPLHVAA